MGVEKSQTIWMNVVPEPKSVKHRVHVDLNVASPEELITLGATMLEPAEDFDRRWSVMLDPEGGEFCAFVHPAEELSAYRMHELVIDCVDPRAIAAWWAGVFGCTVDGREDKDWWWISAVPGCPFGDWDFVPVPEPKTVKNRIHWDVFVEAVDDLVAAGAVVLRPQGDDPWTVLADPEGNEFCAFVREN